MGEPNFIAGNNSLDFNTAVEAVIKRSCIIDYGIVESIPAEGIVNVAVAVASTKQNMFYMSCVLANIASSSFTLRIKPNIGDRVLVIYPRLYDDNMFTISDDEEERKKVIINHNAKGSNLLSGIAILINQYKKSGHTNLLQIEDGKIALKLLHDKDSDTDKITFETSNNGDVYLNSNGNVVNLDKDGALSARLAHYKEDDTDKHHLTLATDSSGAYTITNDKSTFSIGSNGYLDYKQTEQGNNTQFKFSDSGFVIKDKAGNNIVSDTSNGPENIVINGNLKVKK